MVPLVTASDSQPPRMRWESLLPRLHSLDALLGNIDWRERFVAVCLASRPMEERNAVLNFAGDTLSGLRWEVISNFCKAAPCHSSQCQ